MNVSEMLDKCAEQAIVHGGEPTDYLKARFSCESGIRAFEKLATKIRSERFKIEKDYRFPAFVTYEHPPVDQLDKILEEVEEARDAFNDWIKNPDDKDKRVNYLTELLDIIHSCETELRNQGVGSDVLIHLTYKVINKNKARGYYD